MTSPNSAPLVCGCGIAPDAAPAVAGCSPTCMLPEPDLTDLTAEETAQVDAMRAQLRLDGYVEVDQHRQLSAGARVRHTAHRWPEAYEHGTGRVLRVTEKPNSSWSHSWHMPDVEMLVLWDRDSSFGRISQLAQYHVVVVQPATTDAEPKELQGE